MLATSLASAASRFSDVGEPWQRTDGVLLTATATELLDGAPLLAPIDRAADGTTEVAGSGAWTGFEVIDELGVDTCAGWTSSSGALQGIYGMIGRSNGSWADDGSWACSATWILAYCLEE